MYRRPPCSPLFPYTTLFRSLIGKHRFDMLSDGDARSFRDRAGIALAHLLPLGHAPASRAVAVCRVMRAGLVDRKSTRLNSSHMSISYAVFCLKKKSNKNYLR